MSPASRLVVCACLPVVLAACSDDPPSSPRDAGLDAALDVAADAGADVAPEAAPDAAPSHPAANCAATFGTGLTVGFGRIDGVVRAVVGPQDTQCAMPNGDHVVVQVDMRGATYRMVVNIESSRGTDRRIRMATVPAPLPLPAWSEGWHEGVQIDYALTLRARPDVFTPRTLEEAARDLAAAIPVGARVSVYATSGEGRPESAHLVHRNGRGNDGAIVLDPAGPSPRWLLFHFPDQTF